MSAGADKVGYCEGAAYFMQGVGAGVSVASKYIASTVPVPQAKGVALGGFFAGLIINGAGNLLSYACTGRSTGGNAIARLTGELNAEEYEASDEFVGPPRPTEEEADSPMTPEEYEDSPEFVGPPAPEEDGCQDPMNDNYIDPQGDARYGARVRDLLGNSNKDFAKDLSGFDPFTDPLDESYDHHGTYTGPSLGAVTGSNGGTSTGSWTNPYGFGGYSGPSIDAIGFSHGGSSTGTFDPLF